MQIYRVPGRFAHGLACGRQSTPTGSRLAVVTHARRKGVSKELQELQQLKDSPTAAATAPPPPQPPTPSPPPSPIAAATAAPPAALASNPSPTPSQQPQAVPVSSSTTTTATNSSTASSTTSSSSGGNSLSDNLVLRILGSVVAIMAVINIFYSVVFYGASSAVYVFRDQLAAITKKDFVPYSERRRLEQEVLAKLEADQELRLRAQGSAGEEAAEGTGQDAGAAETEAEDAGSSAELLNLLPSSSKKK